MTVKLAAVQFPHPGKEHKAKPYVGSVFPWNVGEHCRKFLEAPGRWATADATGEGMLRFWGEWEAPSDVVEELSPAGPGHPRFVHRPRVEAERSGRRQNTDPLVLDGFRYSNCRQHQSKDQPSPTKMAELDVGSVILFGSMQNGWVLDTVFVVGSRETYGRGDIEALTQQDPMLGYAAVQPLYSNPDRHLEFVLYRGATIDSPVESRYSFVPAVPAERGSFARPHITHPTLNYNLSMATRLLASTAHDVHELWSSMRDQVLAADLVLATSLAGPPLPGGSDAGSLINEPAVSASVGRASAAC